MPYVFVRFFVLFFFFRRWFPDENSKTPGPIALKFSAYAGSTLPLCAIVFRPDPISKMAASSRFHAILPKCCVLEQFPDENSKMP